MLQSETNIQTNSFWTSREMVQHIVMGNMFLKLSFWVWILLRGCFHKFYISSHKNYYLWNYVCDSCNFLCW